jgi:hypothetical protein
LVKYFTSCKEKYSLWPNSDTSKGALSILKKAVYFKRWPGIGEFVEEWSNEKSSSEYIFESYQLCFPEKGMHTFAMYMFTFKK